MVNWQTIATIASTLIALATLNLGALKWMLDRHDSTRKENTQTLTAHAEKIALVEKGVLQLRADLPLEYVRREDWIRFSNTLEAKLDALRAEFRSELSDLKVHLDG